MPIFGFIVFAIILAVVTYYKWKKHGAKRFFKNEIETQVTALQAVWVFTKIIFVAIIALFGVIVLYAIGVLIGIYFDL